MTEAPGGKRHHVEESNALRASNEGKTNSRGGKENADQEGVHHHDTEIIGPSPAAPDGLGSSGSDEFPNRHQGKHTAKRGQPDILLICEQGVAHVIVLAT